MSKSAHVLELKHEPAPLSWVEQAAKEITELQEAAKADPKAFFGNRSRGAGDGLTRVKALLPVVKNIEQGLSALNRIL